MKLIFYEIYKIITKKTFIFLFIALLFGNIFLVSFSESKNFTYKQYIEYKDEYLNLLNICKKMPDKDAVKLLEKKEEEQNDIYIKNGLENEIFYPVYDMVKEKYDYKELYSDFINGMEKRAEKQLSTPLYSNKNSFSYKNIIKTTEDFDHLKSDKIKVDINEPVEKALKFKFTDLIVVGVILIISYLMFFSEIESGLSVLNRVTKNGRLKLGASKIASSAILTIITAAIFYISTLITEIIMYGNNYIDFSNPIQSLSHFRNCFLNLNIGQFIALWLLGKVAMLLLILFLTGFLFLVLRNAFQLFLIIGATGIVSVLLNLTIDERLFFNHLKFINFYYFINTTDLFGVYQNINFIGLPVNIIAIYIILVPLLIICFAILFLAFFNVKNTENKKPVFFKLINKRKLKSNKSGSVSVFAAEVYKILIKDKMLISVLLIAFCSVYLSLGTYSVFYKDEADRAYAHYANILYGGLSKEKTQLINEQSEYFEGLEKQLDYFESKEGSQSANTESISSILESTGEGFKKAKEQYQYLEALEKENKVTPQFVNEIVFENFTTNAPKEFFLLFITIILTLVIISNIFIAEFKPDVIILLRSTKKGKSYLFKRKLLLTVLCSIFVFASVYLPQTIQIINTYGLKVLNIPIISLQYFSNIGFVGLTLWQFLLFISILNCLIVVLISCFIQLLALTFKNRFFLIIVFSIILFTLYLFIASFLRSGFFNIFSKGNDILIFLIMFILIVLIVLIIPIIKSLFINKAFKKPRRMKNERINS